MSLSNSLSLLFLLGTSSLKVSAEFILTGTPLVTERLNPLLNPGQVSGAVQNVFGGSNFAQNVSRNDSLASKCSSLPVQVDHSNYWGPQLYYYNTTNATFSAIQSYANVYYLPAPGPSNGTVQAFPAGLEMVAGNSTRRSYNASSFADQAISYACLDFGKDHSDDSAWNPSPTFFNHQCPDGLKAQIYFPSCWDGTNLTSVDGSHMAYPMQNYTNGDCPTSHPVHLVSLYYEIVYAVAAFPFNGPEAISWVWSNGDVNGTTLQANFVEAWVPVNGTSILQNAIDTCGPETGGQLHDCAALLPYIDFQAASACRPEMPIVNETVGFGSALAALPGCNPLWTNNGTKPSCNTTSPLPTLQSPLSELSSGYSLTGCVAEGSTGLLLTGPTFSGLNMTGGLCTDFCATYDLQYAGVEFGQHCYCGADFTHGGNGTVLPWSSCNVACAGQTSENCGGSSKLSLYRNAALTPARPILTKGWSAAGCLAKPASSHNLGAFVTTSTSMTIEKCVGVCAQRNFTLAGLESASTCTCGDVFSSTTSSTDCSLPCAGNFDQFCGGIAAVSTYRFARVTSSLSASASSSASMSGSSSASMSKSTAMSTASRSSSVKPSSAASESSSSIKASSSVKEASSVKETSSGSSKSSSVSISESVSASRSTITASHSSGSVLHNSAKMSTVINSKVAIMNGTLASANATTSSFHIVPTMVEHRRRGLHNRRVSH